MILPNSLKRNIATFKVIVLNHNETYCINVLSYIWKRVTTENISALIYEVLINYINFQLKSDKNDMSNFEIVS